MAKVLIAKEVRARQGRIRDHYIQRTLDGKLVGVYPSANQARVKTGTLNHYDAKGRPDGVVRSGFHWTCIPVQCTVASPIGKGNKRIAVPDDYVRVRKSHPRARRPRALPEEQGDLA